MTVENGQLVAIPVLPQVEQGQAEIAWSLYDLEQQSDRFQLVLSDTIYTEYWAAINKISTPETGKLEDFLEVLQQKLDNKLDNPPETQTINDIPLQ